MLRSIRKISTRSIFNNVFSKVDEDIIFRAVRILNAGFQQKTNSRLTH